MGEAVDAFYATPRKHTLEDVVKNRKVLGKVLFTAPLRIC